MSKHFGIASLAGLALCGCATPPPSDFGQSVKQMQQAQVYDRSTLEHPSTAPVTGGDADMLNVAVQTMRAEHTERAPIMKPLTINVGESGR